MIFQDDKGKIFDPEEKGIATAVTTRGSTLALTAAEIGTTTTVIARNFWVGGTEGTALIDPVDWTNSVRSGRSRWWMACRR